MKNRHRHVLLCVIALGAAGATSARADVLDLNFTGIVTDPQTGYFENGIDYRGLFGAAGASLAGESFSADFFYLSSSVGFFQDATLAHPFAYTLTINGHSVTSGSIGNVFVGEINAYTTGWGDPRGGWITGLIETSDSLGRLAELGLSFYSKTLYPGHIQPNIQAASTYSLQPGDIQDNPVFFTTEGSTSVSDYIELDIQSMSISSVSAVPETSTWAMLMLGFCGLGLVGCRRAPKRFAV